MRFESPRFLWGAAELDELKTTFFGVAPEPSRRVIAEIRRFARPIPSNCALSLALPFLSRALQSTLHSLPRSCGFRRTCRGGKSNRRGPHFFFTSAATAFATF